MRSQLATAKFWQKTKGLLQPNTQWVLHAKQAPHIRVAPCTLLQAPE